MTEVRLHHTLDFLSNVWKYAQDKNDETLHAFIDTYLQHQEITYSFSEIRRFEEIEEPVLHRAVNNRDTELIEFLIDKAHVHPFLGYKGYSTAIDCAAKNGDLDMIELLMDPRFTAGYGDYMNSQYISQSLIYAIDNEQIDVILSRLLDGWPDATNRSSNDNGSKPLHFAATKG